MVTSHSYVSLPEGTRDYSFPSLSHSSFGDFTAGLGKHLKLSSQSRPRSLWPLPLSFKNGAPKWWVGPWASLNHPFGNTNMSGILLIMSLLILLALEVVPCLKLDILQQHLPLPDLIWRLRVDDATNWNAKSLVVLLQPHHPWHSGD